MQNIITSYNMYVINPNLNIMVYESTSDEILLYYGPLCQNNNSSNIVLSQIVKYLGITTIFSSGNFPLTLKEGLAIYHYVCTQYFDKSIIICGHEDGAVLAVKVAQTVQHVCNKIKGLYIFTPTENFYQVMIPEPICYWQLGSTCDLDIPMIIVKISPLPEEWNYPKTLWRDCHLGYQEMINFFNTFTPV